MDAELMLRWMSETGAGSIRDLGDKLRWLARTSDLSFHSFAGEQWLRDASMLAHAEVRWDADRWAIAPTVITRLPAADGSAVVVGARPASLRERLEDSNVSFLAFAAERVADHLPSPETWIVQFDDVATLQKIAEEAGAVYGGCAAVRLSNRLPALALGSPAAPPSAVAADLDQMQPNGQFSSVEPNPTQDGLYRMRVNNRRVHLYRRDGDWYHCDRSTGIYSYLARRGTSVLRWRRDKGRGREITGTLFVDRRAPLPVLHARAATLCSGFTPRLNQAAQTFSYGNVPRTVAGQIAASLSQNLEEVR